MVGLTPAAVAFYHFDDLSGPRTIAAFAEGQEGGLTEHEVVRLASL
jgi:hypothetical protein